MVIIGSIIDFFGGRSISISSEGSWVICKYIFLMEVGWKDDGCLSLVIVGGLVNFFCNAGVS